MTDPVSNSLSTTAGVSYAALAVAQAQVQAQPVPTAPAGGTGGSPPSSSGPAPSSATNRASGSAPGGSTVSAPPALNSPEAAEAMGKALAEMQSYLQPQQTATLHVDQASGEAYVKIVDAKTQQLIIQIPPADVLAMAQKLRQMDTPQTAAGVLVDQEG